MLDTICVWIVYPDSIGTCEAVSTALFNEPTNLCIEVWSDCCDRGRCHTRMLAVLGGEECVPPGIRMALLAVVVTPSPATHAIWTPLKAGECLRSSM